MQILDRKPDYLQEVIADARGDFLNSYLVPKMKNLDVPNVPERDVVMLAEGLTRQIEMFARDDALVEECVCDTLSIGALYAAMRNKGSPQLAIVRTGIFRAAASTHTGPATSLYRWVRLRDRYV